MLVVGGRDDQGIVDSVEVIDLSSGQVRPHLAGPVDVLSILDQGEPGVQVSEVVTSGGHTPLWGGNCWVQPEGVLVAGGMDTLFLPHASAHLLTWPGLEWREAVDLPWAASGALSSSLGARPTLYGGFGLGYRRGVAALQPSGVWRDLGRLGAARVSGLAVSLPSDLWDTC